ncbi:MAG: 30S ribosomal protein S4e [DPANN group archaeon]|nr:30S ribosomal protein S4e [DPANN group archaeon]
MPKNHLKAQNAPRTWAIKRKNITFVTKPNSGAHRTELSMPLNLVLKNLLRKATTNKEAKKILHNQEILVNGRRRKDYKFSIGLLDILSIPKTNEYYLMLINTQNKLLFQSIDKKESNQKICKITGKKIVKKGLTQLKTLDGRIILVKKDTYKTGDTVLVSLPKQEIKEVLKLEKGATVILFRGKYTGTIATVVEVKDAILIFKLDSQTLETRKEYSIVIGKDKPLIKTK